MVRNIENGLALIEKWLRNKNTIEFLGIWESMYNPDFNSPEFEGINIAFEFATWVSPQFKLYLIQEFERMKTDEQKRLSRKKVGIKI